MSWFRKPVPTLAGWQLALLGALYIVIAGNQRLFGEIGDRLGAATGEAVLVLGSTLALLVCLQVILFMMLGGRRLLKPLIMIFAVLTAVVAYFDSSLGVIFDPEMIRNVVDTIREGNRQEALDLASMSLGMHVALFCAPLGMILLWVRIRRTTWTVDLRQRLLVTVTAIVVIVAAAAPFYRDLSYFWRENRDLRVHVMPLFPILSAERFAERSLGSGGEAFHDFKDPAVQEKNRRKPLLGVLVVGETARSDHFSLNGYQRDTNRYLQGDGVVSFANVTSCGTSTAYSIPCMFSLEPAEAFDPDEAGKEFNVLDVLEKAGVSVAWIDANSGCKGVCRRVETIDLNDRIPADRASHVVYDEDLVPFLSSVGSPDGQDKLLVMHMLGSHGPAYSERYPRDFGLFEPSCTDPAPQQCDPTEVVNAYDNTIAYTDYVLHRLIGELQSHGDEYDTFLLYVSDHGESLGENGVYLHGWPNRIAPPEQKAVAVIAWMSDDYYADHGLSREGLAGRAHAQLTHDFVSHSLLGLFDVRAAVYSDGLDVFRPEISAAAMASRPAGVHTGS